MFARVGSAPQTAPRSGCVRLGIHRHHSRSHAEGVIRAIAWTDLAAWADALDVPASPFDIATWPVKAGSDFTQATEAKKPSVGFWAADGRAAVAFDGLGEAMSTGQLLTGETGTVAATCKSTDGAIGARVVWEQTELYNSAANGAIFGFASSGTPTSGVYAGAGDSSGGDFKVGTQELDGLETCIAATFNRASASFDETIYVNGMEETASQSADIAVEGNFGAGTGSWLGSRNDGAARPLNGTIREIVWIDRELTAMELALVTSALRARAGLK